MPFVGLAEVSDGGLCGAEDRLARGRRGRDGDIDEVDVQRMQSGGLGRLEEEFPSFGCRGAKDD